MMNYTLRIMAAGALHFGLAAGPALADALDGARAAGQVGERADGLIGAVGGVPASVAQTIATLNAKRLATYRDIAQKTGTPIDAVQKQAGDHLIAATPAGQFVMDGSWHKK
jgi:uncharacterized protein YdbL (DUF1318 family)